MDYLPDQAHTKIRYCCPESFPVQKSPCSKGKQKKAPDRAVITQKDHPEHKHRTHSKKKHVGDKPSYDPGPEKSPEYIYRLIRKHNSHTTQKRPQQKYKLILDLFHLFKQLSQKGACILYRVGI